MKPFLAARFRPPVSGGGGGGGGGGGSPPEARTRWRVLVSAPQSGTYVSIAEVEFRTSIGGATVTTGGTAISSSDFNPGYLAANAFDAINGSEWASLSGMPQWVGYEFAAPVAIVEFAIRATDAAYAGPNERPKDFILQSSPDGTVWTDIATVVNQTGWTDSELRVFDARYVWPAFASQVTGLHFNGVDGSTTFTDVTGATFTALGSPLPEIDTAQSKFGGASALFSGTGYLEDTDSRYTYGTGNFCWAGWVRLTTTAGNQYILDHGANQGTLSYESNELHYYNPVTGLGTLYYTGVSLAINQWHYIEASRVSGVTYLFKNGTLIASATDTYNGVSDVLRFGVYGGGGANLNNGFLDDWALWKGVGGHTANYTPPSIPFNDA